MENVRTGSLFLLAAVLLGCGSAPVRDDVARASAAPAGQVEASRFETPPAPTHNPRMPIPDAYMDEIEWDPEAWANIDGMAEELAEAELQAEGPQRVSRRTVAPARRRATMQRARGRRRNARGRNRGFRVDGLRVSISDGSLGHPVSRPGQAIGLPGQAVGRPGQAVGLPGQAVGLPGQAVGLPGQAVGLPGQAVGLPGKAIERPQHPVGRPGQAVNRPEHPVKRPGHAVRRPQHPVKRPQHPVTRPGHSVRLPGHPVGSVPRRDGRARAQRTPRE